MSLGFALYPQKRQVTTMRLEKPIYTQAALLIYTHSWTELLQLLQVMVRDETRKCSEPLIGAKDSVC